MAPTDLSEVAASNTVNIVGMDASGLDTTPANTEDGNSDGVLATLFGLITKARLTIFNGSTWDRARSAGIGDNVGALGLLVNAVYGRYNTPAALTVGNYSAAALDENSVQMSQEAIAAYALQGRVFSISTNYNNFGSGAESPYLYVKNNGTKTLRIFKAKQGIQATGSSATFRTYLNPTGIAAGTTLTPNNHRTGSAATSTAAVLRSPTATGNGTFFSLFDCPRNAGTFIEDIHGLITLDPGKAVLITVVNGAAAPVLAELYWVEI